MNPGEFSVRNNRVLYTAMLFVLVGAAYLALRGRTGALRPAPLADWAAFLVPIFICGQVLLWVNGAQTGHPLSTGYHVVRPESGPTLVLQGTIGQWGLSLASSALRLNFWLLGFPLSLAFCLFARRRPATPRGRNEDDCSRALRATARGAIHSHRRAGS